MADHDQPDGSVDASSSFDVACAHSCNHECWYSDVSVRILCANSRTICHSRHVRVSFLHAFALSRLVVASV